MNVPILLLSVTMSILNILPSIVSYLRTPANFIFIGAPHYWEDYLLYLNHFYQGAHGAWLVANRFTGEPTPRTMIYETNLLMGKILGMVSPVLSYHLWLVILSILSIILMYRVIRLIGKSESLAVIGTFYGVSATSLINYIWVDGKSVWWPFQIWRTPHFAFDRLGGAPHQLMQTVLSLLLILTFFTSVRASRSVLVTILIGVEAALLTLLNPVQAVFFTCIFWLTAFIRKINLLPLLAVTVMVGVMFVLVSNVLNTLPHIQSKLWEAQQITTTTVPFLLASIGPIFLWVIFGGIISLQQKLTAPIIFGLLTILLSYAIFMSPIPHLLGVSDLRFLYPATYVFWGFFAAIFHRWIVFRSPANLRSFVSLSLLAVFILISLPTLRWEMSERMKPPDTATKQIMMIPSSVYEAYTKLVAIPYDDIVLGNPITHNDSLIPPLSGHTTFSGHPLATIGNDKKQQAANAFYSTDLTSTAAQTFLSDAHIRYILYTRADGDSKEFAGHYPFLSVFFQNPDATIFLVQ